MGGAGQKSPDAGVGLDDEGFVHDLKLVAVEVQQLQSTIRFCVNFHKIMMWMINECKVGLVKGKFSCVIVFKQKRNTQYCKPQVGCPL